MTKLRNGETKKPSLNIIVPFCSHYNVNIDYITNGVGEMFKNKSQIQKYELYKSNRSYDITYVDCSAAASFIESLYGEEHELLDFPVILKDDEVNDKDILYVFDVKGDSMETQIHDGDKILCKKIPESKWEYASGVAVVVYDKIITIKRISSNHLFGDNIITLSADNPKYGNETIERRSIRGILQVLRIIDHKII